MKKQKLTFICIGILMLSYACKNEVTVKKIKTFSIPYVTRTIYNLSTQTIKNEESIIYIDKIINKKLYARNLKDNKLLLEIDLSYFEKTNPDAYYDFNPSCFHFSNDTIFLLEIQKNNVVFALNYNSKLLKTYKTSDTLTMKDVLYFFNSTPFSPFIFLSSNHFLCSVLRYLPIYKKEGRYLYYILPKIVKINLLKDSFKLKEIPIIMPYIARSHPELNYDDDFIYFTKFNDNVVYGIMRTPWIFKYNLQTNKTDSSYLPSKYIQQDSIKPINNSWYYKDVYNNSEIYYAKTPFYMDVFYNPNKHCFFRIAKHIKALSIEGEKNKNENWSLLVFDENLKLINEIAFINDSLYNRRMFAITKKGFIIGMNQTKDEIKNKTMRLCEFEVSF